MPGGFWAGELLFFLKERYLNKNEGPVKLSVWPREKGEQVSQTTSWNKTRKIQANISGRESDNIKFVTFL